MRENETTEFKSELTNDTAKTVVAFSNCKGGKIIVGVNDSGEIIGIKNVDETSIKASQMIRDGIRPDVTGNVTISNDDFDGKETVTIDVKEGPLKPYYLREKGLRCEGVFVRNGPVTINATDGLIRKMLREEKPYEAMISQEQSLTFESTARIMGENGIEFNEPQMKTMGLFKDGKYTNLAYLLSDQCTHGIKIAIYPTKGKDRFIDRCVIEGSVLEQIGKAYDFIDRYNPVRTVIRHGVRRKDYRGFSETAIREAILNAIAHREYSINGSTLISVFDDEITINSLGGLNPDICMDDLLVGISSPRNPKLCSILYRLEFIESFGTGIPTIFREYEKCFDQPKIKITTNVFSLTLPPMNTDEDISREGKRIMNMLSDTESISRVDVEKKLGVSKTKATNVLNELIEYGYVNIDGIGKSTRYLVKKDGRN